MNVTLFSDQYPALVVAESAVIQSGSRASLYVVKDDSSVELRDVTIGKRMPGQVVLSAGVERGETIVVEGTLNLKPGVKVRVLGESQSSLARDSQHLSHHAS